MSATTELPVAGRDPVATVVGEAVERCADALTGCAIVEGDDVTWPAWDMDSEGRAHRVVAGRSDLYSGDAGVAHALARLAVALGRDDLGVLAGRAAASLARRSSSGSVGWLSGEAGVAQVRGGWECGVPAGAPATDLTAGLAGVLLVAARTGAPTSEARPLVARIRERATTTAWGSAWTDPTETGDAARPLCGLAHGASGIVLALVEAAAAWPDVADEALTVADAGLRWESTWWDPVLGGWPDLRDGIAWPALWCHGSAGAGAVRLRLLELAAAGLEAPWPVETVRCEAEVAVQRCGAFVAEAVDAVVRDGALPSAGLSLCHGLGGPMSVLADAGRVLGEPHHVDTARRAAATLVSALPHDPTEWPSGFKEADGDLALLTGVAGTALVLAQVLDPWALPSAALLP